MFNPDKITYFGETDARNRRVAFGIKAKDRTRHVYVIGKTGMGKSTALENMAVQDIQSGEGMAFIDPHGKTAELLLEYVPQDRIKDIVYFAPFDTEYPISFNVMEDVGADKRHLVANGLMSAFKKIWVDAWSARMEYILNNILLALLEYPDSTLVGVNRMLSDKAYRKKVVSNITDPSVKAFWVDEFEKYGERYMQEAGAAIQNKVGQFVSNPLVRNIIGQPKSSFDLRKMMDEQKIIIINLSKGRVGEQNANLLGSMLITKIYLSAMSRADVSEGTLKDLPNFYLYVDEFQSFANESFADILSEARKYKLNLTIAHQYIEQMSEEVRAAVFGNVGTMVTFRVGAYDAEVLEKEFFPTFTAEDLVNLGSYQIYLKLMIDGVSSPPFSATTSAPIEKPEISFRHDILENSRSLFAQPRALVEEVIRKWHLPEESLPRTSLDKPRLDQPRPDYNKPVSSSSAPLPHLDSNRSVANSSAPIARPQEVRPSQRSEVKNEKNEKKAIFDAIMQEERAVQKPTQSAPRPISLETLKPQQKKDDKKPTEQHVSELKRALEALQSGKNVTSKSDQPAPHRTERPAVSPQTNAGVPSQKTTIAPEPEQKKEEKIEKKAPKEISEAELKQLLHVDTGVGI